MARNILVLIPTLDRPKLCARAVRSLLRQTLALWELGIVKNGGTHLLDEYEEALGDVLGHPRVRLHVIDGRGLGNALNAGVRRFRLSRHTHFANLEDDDEWHPDFLNAMYRHVRETGADVAHCLQRQVPAVRQSNGGPINRQILHCNWINFPMCLFDAGLIDRVGEFCEEAGPAVDWDWHLRCLKAGARYSFLPQTLVTHHWHRDNFSLNVDGTPFVMRRMREGVYG